MVSPQQLAATPADPYPVLVFDHHFRKGVHTSHRDLGDRFTVPMIYTPSLPRVADRIPANQDIILCRPVDIKEYQSQSLAAQDGVRLLLPACRIPVRIALRLRNIVVQAAQKAPVEMLPLPVQSSYKELAVCATHVKSRTDLP